MKRILKNKRLIVVVSSFLSLILILGVIFINREKTGEKQDKNISSNDSSSKDINVDSSFSSDLSEEEKQEIDEKDSLKPDENIKENSRVENGTKAEENQAPKAEASKPQIFEDNSSGGITVGNPATNQKYHCASPNHNCQNAEAHAFILNLEKEGCPYCGSHSCKSFYALNEWGYTEYNPSLCPMYDAKKDDTKYCPECGRELWSKDNPHGCFRYLQDTLCECGEYVKKNTCHHH